MCYTEGTEDRSATRGPGLNTGLDFLPGCLLFFFFLLKKKATLQTLLCTETLSLPIPSLHSWIGSIQRAWRRHQA